MARYRGPKAKKARRFNDPIYGPSKALQKKPYPPGQQGRGRRKKQSEYSLQLQEKQKAKYTYGILERQFRKMFSEANRREGITGQILLQMLEARLDNVVFRLGISPSRRGARQLVGHRHIIVNGEVVDIPSFQVKPGDIIGVRERSKSIPAISDSVRSRSGSVQKNYSWLEWDDSQMAGKFNHLPDREQIPERIQEQLIVELYSK